MRRVLSAVFAALCLLSPAAAEEAVPQRHYILTRDVDFYGSDLQALFDTDFDACERACLADPNCKAFTFNEKSNACFPKSDITDRQPYAGAWSAEIVESPAGLGADAAARAAAAPFLGDSDIKAARDQAQRIGWTHPAGQYSLEALLNAAQDRRQQKDWINAMRWMGGAVSHSDAPDQWLEYARLSLLAAEADKNNKYRYRSRALSAAINAYLRAANPALAANSLQLMAQAFEANDRGRDMIPALRLALDRQPNWAELSDALDDAIGKYGFRITEHVAESDSAAPRICAEFSDPLVKSGVDYTPFVKLPATDMAVTVSGNRLCVDGLDHGQRYSLTFREGLPAASGETMAKDVTITQYVRDRSASVRFSGRAYVLPKSPDAALPVETVNVDVLDLTLRQVSDRNMLRVFQSHYFGRPLNYWEETDFGALIGEQVWTGKGEVQNELNRDMTTRLPLGDIIADLPAGIYALSAEVPGADPYEDPLATQWFVLSDLGVTTLSGVDGLHVFVRGLGDAEPVTGATATLISQSNRVLGEVQTDAEGHAHFDAGLTRGLGAAAPALLTVAQGDRDLTFLSLKDPAFDLSDRGVEGREPSPPIDVFLTTDRGAYRAGETIHATVLARDGTVAAIGGLPVTAILTRPDGVEYARSLSSQDKAGGHVFAFGLGDSVPRGSWRLDIKADVDQPALASQTVLVEDFLPERIDFTLSLPDYDLRPGDEPPLTVEAKYLFGAPAGGLSVDGSVVLSEAEELKGYPGYRYGRQDESFYKRTEFFGGGETDDQGVAVMPLPLPAMENADRPLTAEVRVNVAEGSGRPVERRLKRDLAPANPIIGIKQMFDGVVPEGGEAQLQVIALGPDLSQIDMPVRWTLNRVTHRYQWYQQWGSWNWEPITTRKPISSGEAMLGADPLTVSVPVEWGNYELVVERQGGDYVSASSSFYAGWYAPADVSTTPDTLELSLDKPAYGSGEVAQLRLVPRYAGKALVTVMSNRVIAMKAVEVSEGENLIPLDVTDDWGAGAYVTASVVRPMDVSAGRNPARSLGLSYAKVDPGDKQLQVRLDAPAEADPRGTLAASVQVEGVKEGETAYVTVAAVDVGILNLTGFQSPDPFGHYFGQRRLGVEIRDLYGRLIDGMNGAMGQVRSGGDAGMGAGFQSPPPTEELVAYFTGPVEIGADGKASVSFDLPAFNGTVRLMAVAWSPTGVGQAEADVLVRDPVVVTASLPRFLSPGDESRLLLEIVHATGPAGRMGLDVTADGVVLDPASVPSGVTLAEKGKQVLSLPVTAGEVGDHAIRVALTTPEGRQLIKDLTIGVRNNDPEVSLTQRFTLDAGDTFTLDGDVFAGLRPGSGSAVVTAGPLARLNAPALLASLDRYPYGCTEQVTSQAMPLLYLSQLSDALGLGNRDRINKRVDQAVEKVLTRQSSNGAFGLWRAGSGDFWLDAYVSDFLSRARAEGIAVPDTAFRMAMDNLRNRVNYSPDFDEGGGDLAYALMVLAREGAAAMGDLRYYADVKGDAFTTPLAAAQLGAALASYGDQTRADAMFARAARMLQRLPDEGARVLRADYGTHLRDAAGVLSLAVEAGSMAVDRDALVQRVGAAGRAMSTQEASWSLLAAKALVQDPSMTGLEIDGQPATGPFARMFEDRVGAQPMAIRNVSGSATPITLTTTGVPEGGVDQGGYGFRIDRSYYTTEGQQVTLDQVETGMRLVTVLKVTPFEDGGARLIVNDPLPAGFEIDNPNLLRQGDIGALDWLDPADTEYSEFRADRFLAAVDQDGKDAFELAYIVRAISPGEFHHPAATVEDMYRPQYRANTASGRVRIAE
ncbi:alpha-2-macroglobulin family protein [Thalassovita mangrovi]|uniref:Alpha-2-macroglobulin family protein n=1 Tax=Thalassovita mangrovi TaxID=2692236 RepID=A0A6L8LHS3_9RHOB|nr:alpha-2-macroglobulin family protein [Thalassovita mangrovi]MYM55534.1 alpha-2-macroglobulin family protein [Thalassovita mangrovi]